MDLPPPMKYSTRAFSKARLISVGQSPLTKFIGIDFIYHKYSEYRVMCPPYIVCQIARSASRSNGGGEITDEG